MSKVQITNVNETDKNGLTKLHHAAYSNDISLVKQLIAQKACVNARDRSSKIPLHYAAMNNKDESHFNVAKILLESGSDVNVLDDKGQTPFYILISNGNLKIVQLFLNFKSNITTVNSRGKNLLFPAVKKNKKIEVLQLLVNLGLNVNHRNTSGETPIFSVYFLAIDDNCYKIFKFLVNNGADLNIELEKYNRFTFLRKTLFSFRLLGSMSREMKRFHFIIEHTNFTIHSSILILRYHEYDPQNYFSHLWRRILGHLALLLSLDIPVHPNLLKAISKNEEYEDSFEYYKEELSEAKTTKLADSWITFFNILIDNRKKLKNYAGNKDLIEDFNKNVMKFHHYRDFMKENVKKGIKRRELFDKSSVTLSDCLPIFNPNHLIVRDILDCVLSFKDLSKFCN